MIAEMDNFNWDVIGLSETKIKETAIYEVEDEHYVFNSGNGKERKHGVGFLLHKNLINSFQDFKNISDRICVLTLKLEKYKVVLVQAYLPTSKAKDEDVDNLYEEIESIIKHIPKRDILVLSGDFNAKVGQLHHQYPDIVGQYNIGNYNERGLKLVNFCSKFGLIISNTIFQKRRMHTWTSPLSVIMQYLKTAI